MTTTGTRPGWATLLSRPSTTSVLLFVVAVTAALSFAPDFATRANISSMLGDMLAPAIVLLAASLAMTGGVADLSVGSVLGLGAVVYATVYTASGSWQIGVLAALGTGLLAGLTNGGLALVFGVWPLIATLGMLVAARGLAKVISDGSSVAAYTPELSTALKTTIGPLPVPVLVVLGLALVCGALVRRSRWGTHLRATGGDEVVAARAGIRAGRVQLALFVLTSTAAAVAGCIQVMRTGASAVTLGEGTELYVYGALLIAGFRLAGGGHGNPITAFLSLLSLSIVLNIFRLRGMPLPLGDILLGVTLLGAVSLGWIRQRTQRHSPAPEPEPEARPHTVPA
ncbi:ABC transporter permease [Micromonospora sp. WMMA1949]|uniref:ABC transporter permease n=1 Tax=unclassified Micromonospora TaxID=2617518 RepID=UPI0022B5EB46|nr:MULTISPECIES: ABC transporter permease [unclassified Micromonospora]MCZ7428845.1 ABC transporter permease [Micromonospora sp. WMMA1949]WBC07717.1 ABC transporter permease [Micromonospora sp. WMMA1947]